MLRAAVFTAVWLLNTSLTENLAVLSLAVFYIATVVLLTARVCLCFIARIVIDRLPLTTLLALDKEAYKTGIYHWYWKEFQPAGVSYVECVKRKAYRRITHTCFDLTPEGRVILDLETLTVQSVITHQQSPVDLSEHELMLIAAQTPSPLVVEAWRWVNSLTYVTYFRP